MAECVVCGNILNLESDLEFGELIECNNCGTELEISSVAPVELVEAPHEGEDWGE